MKFLPKKIKPVAFMLLAATCMSNAHQLIDVASQSTFNATPMQSTFTRDAMSAHWKKYISEPFFKLDRKYQIGIGLLGAAVGVTAAGYFGHKAFNTIRDRYDRVGAARRAVQRGDTNRLILAAQRALAQERSDIIDACTSDAQREAVSDVFLAKPDFDEQQKMMMLFPVPRGTFNQGADYIFLNRMYESLENQSPSTLLAWILNNRAKSYSHCVPAFIQAISASFDANYRNTLHMYSDTNPIVLLCKTVPVISASGEVSPDLMHAFNALFLQNPSENINIYYQEALPEIKERQKRYLKSIAQNFMQHADDIRHAQNFIYLCNFVGFTPADWAPFRNFRCQNRGIYNLCLSECNKAEAQKYASDAASSSATSSCGQNDETVAASEPIAMQIPSDEDCNTASNDANASAPSAAQAATSAEEPIKVIRGAQTRESFARELIKQENSDHLKALISHPKYPIQDLNRLLAFARASEASDAIIACIKRRITVAVIQGDMSFRDAVNGRRIDLS